MPPEHRRAARLLLAAVAEPPGLATLPAPDWDLLLRVARRARLLARLAHDLELAGMLDSVPARAANHLRAAIAVYEHHASLARFEIDRLAWALGPRAEGLVLLKGNAYDAAGLPPARGRLVSDVDLLVERSALDDIESTLQARGWRSTKLAPYDQRYYRRWMHELPPMRHRERQVEVDLHHTILPRTGRLRPDPALLLADALPLPGTPWRILAPADMVLHSVVHLFQDGDLGDAIRDLVDLDDLLRHFGAKSGFWDGLVPRARRLDLGRPLHYALRHAQRLLGTPIPETILTATADLAPLRPVEALMDRLVPRALLPEPPDHPSPGTALARLALFARSHFLRMPPLLLTRHLGYKSWLAVRGRMRRDEIPG
jgi:hypothetical protein